jgi:hypothetical protein
MIHPQTDAELVAFNYGQRIALAAGVDVTPAAVRHGAKQLDYSDAELASLEALGPDLFWSWCDRGYFVNLPTLHS